MTYNDTLYRCEECDMTFSNEKDFLNTNIMPNYEWIDPVGNSYDHLFEKEANRY